MTKTKITALGIAMLLGIGAAQAADQRDFTIVNNDSYSSIVSGVIAPAIHGTPWTPISLRSPIGPRTIREIGFNGWAGGSSVCYFDVRLTLDDGAEVFFNNVNLCRTENLVVRARTAGF
jgi:hypothetical protein